MSAGKDVWGDRAAAGPPQPFFHSRWVDAPAYVRELGPDAGLPAGFRAAGVACGIKPSGNPDLGLARVRLRQSGERRALCRHRHSRRAGAAQSQERCTLSALRVILANSGCANAATGRRGLEDAAKTQGAAAMAVGAQPEEVLLGSTGGISHYLPVENMLRGILDAQARVCAARATPTSSRRSKRPTRSRSAPTSRSSCPRASCGSARSARAPA